MRTKACVNELNKVKADLARCYQACFIRPEICGSFVTGTCNRMNCEVRMKQKCQNECKI